jgi:hypothetical protein
MHGAMREGETITFQAYHPTSCEVASVSQQPPFRADAEAQLGELTLGTPSEMIGELPEEFALSQNYPNPFNPTTTIEYALPEAAAVQLVVYDLLGRQVVTLVRGAQKAGRYEVVFDASRLASGMYLYRIKAGSFVSFKMMILVE